MKKNTLFGLVLVSLLCAGCSNNKYSFNFNDYKKDLVYSDGFRILQLSDIHYGITTNFDTEFAYLDKVVNKAHPDLIVITGDCFMEANAYTVQTTFAHFSTYNIPWTMVFGNHDTQGIYGPDYVSNTLKTAKNCYYTNFNDDVYGNSNFVFNLNAGNETKWQLYFIDSNSYHFNGIDYDYDVIHSDQIEWYENCIKASNVDLTNPIPSLCFFHIPLFEYRDAYDYIGGESGLQADEYVHEKFSVGYTNTGFFNKAKELKSTKGMFCGHDHVNSFAIDYQGITLSYGVKTGDGIYHENEHIGGQVITLRDDGSFDPIERIFMTYGE